MNLVCQRTGCTGEVDHGDIAAVLRGAIATCPVCKTPWQYVDGVVVVAVDED
jgi:hypothetical protein